MLIITVCVGSSCHLRGSYDLIQLLEKLIKSHNIEDKIELKASFCMENCSHGASVRIGDQDPIVIESESELEKLFVEQILPQIGGE